MVAVGGESDGGKKARQSALPCTGSTLAEQLFKANYYDTVKAQALEKFGANFTADNVYQLLAANDELKTAIAGAVKAQYLQGALEQIAPNAAAMTGDQVLAAVSGAVPDDATIAAVVDQQLSGMAAKMAAGLGGYGDSFATGNCPEKETIDGARGANSYNNIHIHSVRMPGYMASQEVLFGSNGQLLSIRHSSP